MTPNKHLGWWEFAVRQAHGDDLAHVSLRAVGEHHHLVGQQHGLVHVVGNDDDGHAERGLDFEQRS